MNTTKITDDEIKDLKISSLPVRPNTPTAFGGKGYTSSQMRAAFDRLPLLIIERFNSLLDDVCDESGAGIAASIPTGIFDQHTLADLFADIKSGSIAGYIKIGDRSLLSNIGLIRADLDRVLSALGLTASTASDGGEPQ